MKNEEQATCRNKQNINTSTNHGYTNKHKTQHTGHETHAPPKPITNKAKDSSNRYRLGCDVVAEVG